MKTRILPPAEWSRLQGSELEGVGELVPPSVVSVLVVEDDAGAIVACWSLINVLHAEGLWIHPAHRGRGGVARRLWVAMRRLVRDRGLGSVLTASVSPDVTALLDHAGAIPVPGTAYVLPMGTQEKPCHSLP